MSLIPTLSGDMSEYEYRLARFYAWIDFFALMTVLLIIGGSVASLAFCHIPEAQLAILASLDSALLSAVIAGYAGFRWGASLQNSMKQKAAIKGVDPTLTTITTPSTTTTTTVADVAKPQESAE